MNYFLFIFLSETSTITNYHPVRGGSLCSKRNRKGGGEQKKVEKREVWGEVSEWQRFVLCEGVHNVVPF